MKTEVSSPEAVMVRPKSISPACIHEVFEAQARKTPDAIALTFQQNQVSYRQLDEESNRLAHYLLGLNIKPETPIALYLERTPRMVMAILAVLKVGAAYVPIDLAYPADRLASCSRIRKPR
jgi:non-ribosomal peptide synthetase component F